MVDVRNVNRGANFTALSVQKNLNFTIEVPNTNGVTCKKRFIDRCCNAIVFFNARVKNGHVTIKTDAKFFMTRYNRKRENMITKQLTHTYCVDKYGVGKKNPVNSKNLWDLTCLRSYLLKCKYHVAVWLIDFSPEKLNGKPSPLRLLFVMGSFKAWQSLTHWGQTNKIYTLWTCCCG